VPREIGIIGVGNHTYGEYLRVPSSTVDQKRTAIGEKAATLLLDLIRLAIPPPSLSFLYQIF
jgi:DNA-binding LacI/PurR family transcriptional regulator